MSKSIDFTTNVIKHDINVPSLMYVHKHKPRTTIDPGTPVDRCFVERHQTFGGVMDDLLICFVKPFLALEYLELGIMPTSPKQGLYY